jgi:hypothetical protein
MALDPNIILQGQTQPPATNPIQSIAAIADIQAQVEQRKAAAQNAMSLAQQRIDAARDEASIQAAMQASNGNALSAASALDVSNPRAADLLRTRHAKAVSDSADAITKQATATQNTVDFALRNLNAVDSPEQQAVVEKALSGLDPSIGQLISNIPSNLTWQQRRDHLMALGQSVDNSVKRRQAVADALRDGKYDAAVFGGLSLAQNDQQWAQALQNANAIAPPEVVARAQALGPFSPAAQQQAAQMALNPEQRQQAAATAATLAESKSRDAQTAAFQQAELGIRAGELGVSRAKEAREAASGLMPDGTVSPAVMQYADDVKSGKLALTAVPASGHVRDAVQSYLRNQGLDLTQPLTAQVRARYEFASSVLPQVSQVENLAQQMQAQGLMGTFSGRLRDASSAESAAAAMTGLTPAQQRLVGQFATQADLLASGVAMAHFGARGGSQADEMRKQLTAGGKSLDTFLGNLAAAKSVLQGYANDLPASGSSAAASATAGRFRVKGPNGQSGTVPAGSASTLPAGWSVVP